MTKENKYSDQTFFDKLIAKIAENDEDIEFEFSKTGFEWGGEIFKIHSENKYLLMHGFVGNGFTDYCNYELFSTLDEAKKQLDEILESNN